MKSYYEKCFNGICSILESEYNLKPNNREKEKSSGYKEIQPNYKGMNRRKV